MTTLILGATGHLAGIVARRLLTQGKPVRVMARAPEKLADLARAGAEVVAGDLRDPASLARGCVGASAVLSAATAFASSGANTARAVDLEGNLALIAAARAAGVGRFVQISIFDARPDHPLDLWRYKYAAEQALKASGTPYAIVRPRSFMELFLGVVAGPLAQGKPALIFGPGVNPINWISVEDVASYTLTGLESPDALGQTIEAGGPENLSLVQLAETVGRVTGRPAAMRHIPLPMLRAMSVVARPFNQGFARLAASGVRMNTTDMRFDPSATLRRFPVTLARVEDVARRLYASKAAPRDATLQGA
ncbi:MAG TPA: SDR family oxidoreductase [Ktedonobacterales bacterium]